SIVLIAIDITERKRAENKMQEYLEEIESINEKLDAYSYSISHDLKEPIRAIRTFSDFISEDYTDKLDDRAKDYFSRIIKASDKMTRMIDDLLVLSQVGRKDMEFRAVSVLDLIEEVKDTLRHKIEETNTTISTHGFPTIICQPVWMKAVFQNLVSNSIKYNDKEKTHIEITCRDLPTHYEFAVKDNGLGIHKDYYDRIFALFNKAHQDRNMEGSGAGLAIVASVVEQHQGRVWVDWSKPKEGTIIKFTIDKSLSGNKGIDNRG
ncbi:MAG: hypothetical protein GY847_17580, partial [Proteobacteria bacterium]|nr:hypothetical protein [Pseudomonadota bacterium]